MMQNSKVSFRGHFRFGTCEPARPFKTCCVYKSAGLRGTGERLRLSTSLNWRVHGRSLGRLWDRATLFTKTEQQSSRPPFEFLWKVRESESARWVRNREPASSRTHLQVTKRLVRLIDRTCQMYAAMSHYESNVLQTFSQKSIAYAYAYQNVTFVCYQGALEACARSLLVILLIQ